MRMIYGRKVLKLTLTEFYLRYAICFTRSDSYHKLKVLLNFLVFFLIIIHKIVNTQLLRKPFKQRTSGFREFLFLTKF